MRKAIFMTFLYSDLMVLALLMAVSGPATAQTQACDRHLTPVAGGTGYAWRAEGRRCEGIYKSTVSSVRLQLVSMLIGGLAFDLERHRRLNVKVPEVPLLGSRTVHVRAVALPLKTYYRMDAVLPPEGALQWPLHEIIGRVNLTASKMGVYGWIEDDDGQLFVPLTVTPDDNAAADTAGAPIRIIVRSGVDLQRLVWRTATKNGEELHRQEYSETPVRAGRPIILTLTDGATSEIQVDIAGLPSQSDRWTKLRLRVLRPGE